MPAGSKPGERRGGRRKGTPDLATVEREMRVKAYVEAITEKSERNRRIIERAQKDGHQAALRLQEAEAQGRKLAKEVLEDFVLMFWNLAANNARIEDVTDDEGRTSRRLNVTNIVEYEKWARLCVATARDLAPYQSPRLGAIMVTPPPPSMQTRRFTLAIFDRHNGNGDRPVVEVDAEENVER